MTRKHATAAAVVGGLALFATACGGGGADAPPTATSTVTATATETVTETKEVAKTPQACLDALEAAEEMAGHAGDFASAASTYPALLQDVYLAGVTQANVDDIISEIEGANARMEQVNKRLDGTVTRYNRAAAKCRDAA